MKTLRELALEKYKERQQDDLEAQKAKYEKNTEITRKAFIRLCGCEPEKVAGLTVEDNGLTLVYQYGNHPAIWAVRDQCPNCKNLVLSTACYSLADIGKQIEDFQPYDHDCPPMKAIILINLETTMVRTISRSSQTSPGQGAKNEQNQQID